MKKVPITNITKRENQFNVLESIPREQAPLKIIFKRTNDIK